MKIDKQEADQIINVANDFNNNGELNVKAMYLNISDEQALELGQLNQKALKTQFSIDYLSVLDRDLETKKLISRNALVEIEALIHISNQVAVVGSPGVGKTCLMYELSKKAESVIYLNLKNKSVNTIVLHLINKINLENEQPLVSIIDIEVALEFLQSQLLSSKMTFLLDECETSMDVIQRILPLNKAKNHFIYASQSKTEFIPAGAKIYTLGNFTELECESFLAAYNINISVLAFNELYNASQGNALYLYYFSQYTIHPLPKDLADYHDAIWTTLNDVEKECLIYLALAYLPPSIMDISNILKVSVQRASELIRNLRLANMGDEGLLTVFHPSFKKFIISELQHFGTLKHYQVALGNFFCEKKDYVQAVYLLIDDKPEKIEKFGYDALPALVTRGDLELANRLIEVLLKKKRSALHEGYLKLHLYQNLRSLNKKKDADKILSESIRLLKKSKNKQLYTTALMSQAMDFIDDGKIEEGINLADSIMEDDDGSDDRFSGQLLVNLSKIYVDLDQYSKAADASRKAFEFFSKNVESYGLLASLANLTTSIAMIKDYKVLAKTYAEKLLEITDNQIYFGIELIALNVLTSLNRQSGNYSEAKKYGHRAVYLCQQYKLEQKAILNLINYGNIFRDEGDITGALGIYEEALAHTIKLELKREQARVYWILSSISFENNELDKALEQINISIDLSLEMNYDFGIAHGFEERAGILEKMNQPLLAGESYESSFKVFKRMGNMAKESRHALTNSIIQYMAANADTKLSSLMELSYQSVGSDKLIDLGGIIEYNEGTIDVSDYFYNLTKRYVDSTTTENNITSYFNFLKHCKSQPNIYAKDYKKVVMLFASNIESNHFLKSNLGVLIEQSGPLLDYSDVKMVCKAIERQNLGLFTRETALDYIFLVSFSGGYNLEILCPKDKLLCIKLSLNFILFVMSIPESLKIKRVKKETFCKVIFLDSNILEEVTEQQIDYSFNEVAQTAILKAPRKDTIPVVVNTDYEHFSDQVLNPENKCNMFFIRTLIESLLNHYYQTTSGSIQKLTKDITRKIAWLLEYTDTESPEVIELSYEVDLTVLDKIKKTSL